MSTADTMTPLLAAPWLAADGNPLSVKTLPGLPQEVIQGLERLADCARYPGGDADHHSTVDRQCGGFTESSGNTGREEGSQAGGEHPAESILDRRPSST